MSDMISRADAQKLLAKSDLLSVVVSLRLQAALDALPAVEVAVRELEWVDFDASGSKAQAWNAANYFIQKWNDGRYEISASYPGYSTSIEGIDRSHLTIEAAKAAAQADYAARIRSALTAAPAQDWLSNCAICGRVVDTREISAGGDGYGCEYDNGWACSSECAEKLNPDPDWMKPTPAQDVVEIDLRAVMMEQIEEAANQSPWIPPEYTMNEIISDCCSFLREPRDPSPA